MAYFSSMPENYDEKRNDVLNNIQGFKVKHTHTLIYSSFTYTIKLLAIRVVHFRVLKQSVEKK